MDTSSRIWRDVNIAPPQIQMALQMQGQPTELPPAAEVARARSVVREVIDEIDASGWSFGAAWRAAGVIGGYAARAALEVIERAGPLVVEIAADAAVAWLESKRRSK